MDKKEYQKNRVTLTHLRQRFQNKELVPCLGSGINKPLNLPNWKELVQRIAMNEKVQGKTIFESDILLPAKTQALYEAFRDKYLKEHKDDEKKNLYIEDTIRKEWISLIHDELYKTYKENEPHNHEYWNDLINLVKDCPITVTYNFDDLIECSIRALKNKNVGERSCESVCHPLFQHGKGKPIIYHPNGYLPQNLEEDYCSQFVFEEKSFQNQLLDSIMGHYTELKYIFTKYTLLLIGTSIDDQTLRYLLRQNAVINPGQVHYYIYYKNEGFNMSETDMKALRESYFDTFNLIVLFLDDKEIKRLCQNITMDDDEFEDECGGVPSCNFYITGAPGTGKTTTLKYFTSYNIHSEWPSPRIEGVNKSDNKLNKDETLTVDEWIRKQFEVRNRAISKKYYSTHCVQIIDRTPLDPISYTVDRKTELAKAKALSEEYFKNNRWATKLTPGRIILLNTDSGTAKARLYKRNPGKYEPEWIEKKIQQFPLLFDKSKVYPIDATDLSPEEVVKKMLHAMYFTEYEETNLDLRLNDFIENKCSLYNTVILEHKNDKNKDNHISLYKSFINEYASKINKFCPELKGVLINMTDDKDENLPLYLKNNPLFEQGCFNSPFICYPRFEYDGIEHNDIIMETCSNVDYETAEQYALIAHEIGHISNKYKDLNFSNNQEELQADQLAVKLGLGGSLKTAIEKMIPLSEEKFVSLLRTRYEKLSVCN